MAPACLLAGWWQATRALSGNGLSWAYTVEWPGFALIAVAGWWHLIHEDPEAYQTRRAGPRPSATWPKPRSTSLCPPPAQPQKRHLTSRPRPLVPLVHRHRSVGGGRVRPRRGYLVDGPLGRAAGWLPAQGRVLYLVHAVIGLALAVAAVAFVVQSRGAPRASRAPAWLGLSGVALAGPRGAAHDARSLVRFLGMVLMFLGTVVAVLGYVAPPFQLLPPPGS